MYIQINMYIISPSMSFKLSKEQMSSFHDRKHTKKKRGGGGKTPYPSLHFGLIRRAEKTLDYYLKTIKFNVKSCNTMFELL